MVYPISGQQQQIPAANTFQPGGTESAKRAEENKIPDTTRPSGSEPARSQSSSTRSNNRVEDSRAYDLASSTERSSDNGSVSASSSRGSAIDISV